MQHKFIIRHSAKFVRYVKVAWKYFLSTPLEDVKIVIRKDNVYVHIDAKYCVVLNDLDFVRRHPEIYPHFEANAKSLAWLKEYSHFD